MTAHVHAEVIKAWVDDTSLVVQCKFSEAGGWRDLECVGVAMWNPTLQYRIKPQPKAKWLPIYRNGAIGSFYEGRSILMRAHEYAGPHNPLAYILEVREDGTAHLHPVEA